MIGQLGDAEDAVQEAYARAWQRWNRIGTYADPEGWVRTVAYRIAVSTWRKTRTRLLAHGRHGPADDIPALGPEYLDLVEALRTLTPDQRRAVVLHHLVGLTVVEIATEVGAPEGTVKSRLTRGRRALADRLHEESVTEQPKGG
jgi:RNA polymerase sigma-70 factor (ECF subfamily)